MLDREALLDAAMEAYWDTGGGTREGLRAALAVIEPALRVDIARELDCGCDCRDAVLEAKTRTEQKHACGRDPCSALEAREIRGGSNGG